MTGTVSTSDYETIRYSRTGHVGNLTLARPAKRNAQNPLMWQELADLGETLLADTTLRCLIIAGEGPSFSSGIDLVEGLADALAELAGALRDDQTLDEQMMDAGIGPAGTFHWIPKLGCAQRRGSARPRVWRGSPARARLRLSHFQP